MNELSEHQLQRIEGEIASMDEVARRKREGIPLDESMNESRVLAMEMVRPLVHEVRRLQRDCPYMAALFKKTDFSQLGHEFRCGGCNVKRAENAEAEAAKWRELVEAFIYCDYTGQDIAPVAHRARSLIAGTPLPVSEPKLSPTTWCSCGHNKLLHAASGRCGGHNCGCQKFDPQLYQDPTGEVAAARAAVNGVGKLRLMLESTEKSRVALQKVLLDLAPFVAALSRAPNVSPDARAKLLTIEPEMLTALQNQPKDPL